MTAKIKRLLAHSKMGSVGFLLLLLLPAASGIDHEVKASSLIHNYTATNSIESVEVHPSPPSSSRRGDVGANDREYKYCTMNGLFCIPRNYSK